MTEREYYGVRKGHIPKDQALSFENLKRAFLIVYKELNNAGYFQKYFGKDCVDGDYAGVLGDDRKMSVFLKTGLDNIWPIYETIEWNSEIEFYTLLELLHDTCSKPTDSYIHDFMQCGIHVTSSDDNSGRAIFRDKINPLLKRYKNIEISPEGEILTSIDEGYEPIFAASIPSDDEENIKSRVNAAILKFRRASATVDTKRDALRDLADVLEFIKPKILKLQMNKDTNELFEIANTFGIRHHNPRQKTDYDKPIWHSWIFYCYLSTIHLTLRLINEDLKQNH
jgi:hypothetical protein